jgi:LmbE family N-acetylglucosaminyl deacetylase
MTSSNDESVLVIAPHPDDEVLGVGGTIARLADEGRRVTVAIVTKGSIEHFDAALIERGRQEAREAHCLLGVAETAFLDLPAARLDQIPHVTINAALLQVIERTRPSTVFVPFRGDIHRDHQLVFDSTLVAVRPTNGLVVAEILAYETLSETNWNAARGVTSPFIPDCYVRIDKYLDKKLRGVATYASQLREFPHERSLVAVEALARHRGATIGAPAAEAFMTIRRVI